jgi:uncharacterized protein YcfL
MKNVTFVIFILSVITLGCASIQTNIKKNQTATIIDVEKLNINLTAQSEVIKLFGRSPMQFVNEQKNRVVWLYYLDSNPHRQRLCKRRIAKI